jgi:hypothetical protein
MWGQVDVVEVDDGLMRHAAGLTARFGLRGDRQLLNAWHSLGIATFDPNASATER